MAGPCASPSSNLENCGSHVSQLSGLQLLLLNARSAQNKISLIHDLIMAEEADLACVNETWVGEQGGVGLTQLCPPGYLVQHQGRLAG